MSAGPGTLPDGLHRVRLDAGRPAIIKVRRMAPAMLTLFGAPPRAFFASYQEAAGIDAGWRERARLLNLYHLLNHLNLFGTAYLGGVREVIRRYAGHD